MSNHAQKRRSFQSTFVEWLFPAIGSNPSVVSEYMSHSTPEIESPNYHFQIFDKFDIYWKKWLCIIELWLIDHKFNSISMELILLTKRNTSWIHVQGNEHVFNHTSLTYNLEFLDQIYALKLRNPNLCDYHTNSIEYHQFLQTL